MLAGRPLAPGSQARAWAGVWGTSHPAWTLHPGLPAPGLGACLSSVPALPPVAGSCGERRVRAGNHQAPQPAAPTPFPPPPSSGERGGGLRSHPGQGSAGLQDKGHSHQWGKDKQLPPASGSLHSGARGGSRGRLTPRHRAHPHPSWPSSRGGLWGKQGRDSWSQEPAHSSLAHPAQEPRRTDQQPPGALGLEGASHIPGGRSLAPRETQAGSWGLATNFIQYK